MLQIFADALLIATRQNPWRRPLDHARWPAYPEQDAPGYRDERPARMPLRDPKW